MAPIDFEKELQKRWRSREIEPREQTWTRLSARLEQEGPESARGPKLWMFMAAASVVVMIGFFLLREPAEKVPSLPPVVATPGAERPAEVTPKAEQEAFSDSREAKAESLADSHVEKIRSTPPEHREKRVARADGSQLPGQAATGMLAETFERVSPEEVTYAEEQLPLAASADAPTKPGEAPEPEIDILLKNARERIGLQHGPESLSPGDARALLDRAEDELDQTFREKIMEKLKSGVTRSRTSVAVRNK